MSAELDIKPFVPSEGMTKWEGVNELQAGEVVECGHSLADLKTMRAQLESKRKDIVGPMDKAVRHVNRQAKAVRDKIDGAIEKCAKLLSRYEGSQRLIVEQAVEAEAKSAESRGALQLAAEIRREAKDSKVLELEGLQTRRVRKAEVHNMVALCRAVADGVVAADAVKANTSFLNLLAKSRTGSGDIPGVTFITETSFAKAGS